MKTWYLPIFVLSACAESLIPEAGPPPPGQESAPTSGGMPGPTIDERPPVKAVFEVLETEGVSLSGTLLYEGSESARILLQFLKEVEGQPVHLLHSEELPRIGSFSTRAPADLGPISAVAFLDLDDDGKPTVTDLGGRADLVVKSENIANIEIQIGDISSLGTLIPGSMLPGTGTMDLPDDEVTPPPNGDPNNHSNAEAPEVPQPNDNSFQGSTATTDHPPVGGVEPPPENDPNTTPGAPQAPNVPRSNDSSFQGSTPTTDHPPVGGVEPPPENDPKNTPTTPQAPNVPRPTDSSFQGNTPATSHPPVGGVEPPPEAKSQQTYSNSGIPASALRIINPDPSMAPPPSHPSTGDIEPPPPQEEPEIQEPVRMAPNVPRSLESPYKGKTELDPEPAGGRPPPSENNANSGSED